MLANLLITMLGIAMFFCKHFIAALSISILLGIIFIWVGHFKNRPVVEAIGGSLILAFPCLYFIAHNPWTARPLPQPIQPMIAAWIYFPILCVVLALILISIGFILYLLFRRFDFPLKSKLPENTDFPKPKFSHTTIPGYPKEK